MHQHKVDPYFGALFITIIGAGATFLILHTIRTLPVQSFEDQKIQAVLNS